MNKYQSIINVEYPFLLNHIRMNLNSRASIFLPFSALNGYEEALKEKEKEKIFKENVSLLKQEEINEVLLNIKKNISSKPSVLIKYYDYSNDFLEVREISTKINKINDTLKFLIDGNQEKIFFDDLIDIEIVE